MPLIYITGTPGAGKSTTMRELQARGYRAYGVDEHNYAQWVNRQTNKIILPPKEFDFHTWYENHEWTLDHEAIAKLKYEADVLSQPTFLCGVAAGAEEAWRHFTSVMSLSADAETLRYRIAHRTNNHFGKTEEELVQILEWQEKHGRRQQKLGAATIDGTRSTRVVVDEIIKRTYHIASSRIS